MQRRNLLDDVFKTPEPEVRYFADSIATQLDDGALPGLPQSDLKRIKSGAADKVASTPVFTTQNTARIVIEHGFDGDDYVWHIEPVRNRRWQTSVDRVIYAIAKTMNVVIPQSIKVDIFKPYGDWEIKVITFKAHDLRGVWNISRTDLDELNMKLFEVLGALT